MNEYYGHNDGTLTVAYNHVRMHEAYNVSI